ncbi:MAG: beta-ketoacyl synthase chain length factor [Deltaproteobacteria bacterium]|nr:beta-ketoacyl synthase chain length factor [Deltaproteobacteria bacterium]
MNIHVVSTGLSRGKDLEALKRQGDFRKATHNMMLAWLSIEEALQPLAGRLAMDAMVLGSGFGELEVTRNFLKGLAESGLARPLLFQNSLHNATLGFLAMKLALTGPSITVSNRCFTGENCLEAAMLLLQQGQCRSCLVTGVDALIPELAPALNAIYPVPVTLGEGAATLLLVNDAGQRQLGLPILATLHDVTYDWNATGQADAEIFSHGYYEADAIEILVERLRAGTHLTGTTLGLAKPDGSRSIVHWSLGAG